MNKQEVNNQRIILILAVIFAVCVALYALRSVLLPFVVGIVVAYFLDPTVNRLVKYVKISRSLATILVLGIFLLILLPIIAVLGSMIFSQIGDFLSNLPEYVENCMQKLKNWLENMQEYIPAIAQDNWEGLWQEHQGESVKSAVNLIKKIVQNGFAVVNVLSLLLISPVVAFYMLRDWHDFTGKALALIPKKHQKNVVDGVNAVNRIVSGYLRGQLLVCVVLGCFYSLGLWVIGLKLGLLVGLLAGMISFIPYVGSISGFLMAIVLAVTQYGTLPEILMVVAVFGMGQFLEGNFLTPKLVGENIGLHPVWVMFALLSGGALLGILGMIIAVPVAACIGVLLRFMIRQYKESAIYLEK